MAIEELQSFFANKKIAVASDAPATVLCRIEVTYGNRALRYFVGFGAGAGHIQVTVELQDKTGRILYATDSKADLAVGVFGGDMAQVVRNTIQAAVKEFGSRL